MIGSKGLAALREYVRQHGNAYVPQAYETEAGFKLGLWCNNRRQFRRRGKLAAERVEKLDAFGFVWGPLEIGWQQGLVALHEYVQQHGDPRVPVDYKNESGFKLGAWCHKARQRRKREKLASERVAALNNLGFVWDLLEDTWRQGFDELRQFVQQHGHARIPRGHVTGTGIRLGLWCDNRRQQRRRGKLAPERVVALDALGFIWDPYEDEWQQGLAALDSYVRARGSARVPTDYQTKSGFKLGLWCTNRRQQRKRGKLGAERIAMLDELGFPWQLRAPRQRIRTASTEADQPFAASPSVVDAAPSRRV
jgi:hypothetical protein